MKKVLLSMALAVAAPFAWAQVSETTTTTTTTEGNGTITEFSPGSTIVLKESAGPRHYRFGKKVTYVTRSGKELGPALSFSTMVLPGENSVIVLKESAG